MNPLAFISIAVLAILAGVVVTRSDPSGSNPDDQLPAPPSGPVANASSSVVLLGDSIGVGLSSHLAKLVGGRFEARVKTGRTAQGAVSALQGDENTFDFALLSLGSNDALLDASHFPGALAAMVSGLNMPVERIFWIVPPGFTYNTGKSPAGVAAFTQAMLDAGIRAIASSPVPPAPDDPMRLHLAPSGYAQFAASIARGLYE
jgi:hypothetical protein